MLTLYSERTIHFHEDFFKDFFLDLPENEQEKILYVLDLVKKLRWVPEKFLKHMRQTEGLFEIRVRAGHVDYRIFCFFDSDSRVILLNGFKKKSQKTPAKELNIAVNLMRTYKENKTRRQ
jgi:phage-related protein